MEYEYVSVCLFNVRRICIEFDATICAFHIAEHTDARYYMAHTPAYTHRMHSGRSF